MTYEYSGDNYGNFTGIVCLYIAFTLVPAILIFLFSFPVRYQWNR